MHQNEITIPKAFTFYSNSYFTREIKHLMLSTHLGVIIHVASELTRIR